MSPKIRRKKAVTTLGVSLEVMVTIVSMLVYDMRNLGDLQATYIGVIIHLLRLLFLFFLWRCFGYTWDHPSVAAAMDGNGRLIGIPF